MSRRARNGPSAVRFPRRADSLPASGRGPFAERGRALRHGLSSPGVSPGRGGTSPSPSSADSGRESCLEDFLGGMGLRTGRRSSQLASHLASKRRCGFPYSD
jgi:hypothetical protein